jgi:NAD-dependent dihydropyrimidine dehydrogenase PreA subunit
MTWVLAVPLALLLLVAAVFLVALVAFLVLWMVGERGHLMLPSTRAVLRGRRPGSRPALRVDGTRAPAKPPRGRMRRALDALHAYVYGRWPERYIGVFLRYLLPRASEAWKLRWADHYHGKVLTHELAREIITLDHNIPRTDLEQIVPYARAREILLRAGPNVTVMDCPCRMTREEPCLPLDVCMLVGGGEFVLDHIPDRSRRITREEALAILEAEHARGHVHTAYFKDVVNDRFYAICNCCPCCCGGMEAMMKHGVPMVASSGYVAQVDPDLCIACEECVDACPFDAVHLEGETAVVKWADCMGCGVCEIRCATGGMSLLLAPEKGLPLDVRTLGRARETTTTEESIQ